MNKENTSDFSITVKLSTTTKVLVGVGIILIILSNIIPNFIPEKFLNKYLFINSLFNILEIVGTTSFSAGLVSVIVEISTIKSLVSDALNNVLLGELPLDSYSDNRLEGINNLIAARRRKINKEFVRHSIYSLEPKLIELLDGLYYEYYFGNYVITPDIERGVFKKQVTLKYEIINKFDKDNKISHLVSFYDTENDMDNYRRKQKFNVTKFIINKTDLSQEVDNYIDIVNITQGSHSTYQYTVKFERELQHCQRHKIHIEFEYEVPIHDITQVFRLTLPCKKIEHAIYMQNGRNGENNWKLHGHAFTSFYCKEEDGENSFRVEQHVDSNIKINFQNWCIPGAGYVIYFSKK